MYTLIMCIGFSHGVCEHVARIDYPTQEECRIDLNSESAKHPELIYSVCAPKKEATSAK